MTLNELSNQILSLVKSYTKQHPTADREKVYGTLNVNLHTLLYAELSKIEDEREKKAASSFSKWYYDLLSFVKTNRWEGITENDIEKVKVSHMSYTLRVFIKYNDITISIQIDSYNGKYEVSWGCYDRSVDRPYRDVASDFVSSLPLLNKVREVIPQIMISQDVGNYAYISIPINKAFDTFVNVIDVTSLKIKEEGR